MKLKRFDAIQVIRIYNSKLDDREKRKRFVIDRGLVDKREQIAVSCYFFFHFFFCDLSRPLLFPFLLLYFPLSLFSFSPLSFLLVCHIPFFFCVFMPLLLVLFFALLSYPPSSISYFTTVFLSGWYFWLFLFNMSSKTRKEQKKNESLSRGWESLPGFTQWPTMRCVCWSEVFFFCLLRPFVFGTLFVFA